MSTNHTSKENVVQKIQLVEGAFTPSEAADVIINLLDEKINFHKLQRLRDSEGNHSCDTHILDGRIGELEKEKKVARDYIKKVKKGGQKLRINGILEITTENDN
ncbi:MAG: hypothetical protein WBG46_13395 [Nonlabens sp.]